jgi:alpha-D-ribose 1-methylphosphonate 5-triphosphate synthase subunit PhnI
MGYTAVQEAAEAVEAAAALVARRERGDGVDVTSLVDQVCAEAGFWEPALARRALDQANGDGYRAVALLRAWGAVLPREEEVRCSVGEVLATRRITPTFRDPPGGQYLGINDDFTQRLLALDGDQAENPVAGPAASASAGADVAMPASFPRAAEEYERRDLIDPGPRAEPADVTRDAADPSAQRGAFLQLLARAETGTLVALAYRFAHSQPARQEPGLVELRSGTVPVHVTHPRTQSAVRVGAMPVTVAETVVYRGGAESDRERMVLGTGATAGRVERGSVR